MKRAAKEKIYDTLHGIPGIKNILDSRYEKIYRKRCAMSDDEIRDTICEQYRAKIGKNLNLQDPQTFNEKIQWLKIYDNTPEKGMLADKYLVREWVKDRAGDKYLIPLIGVWDSFDKINFDELPDKFVLKANNGSGWNIIVRDKSSFDRKEAERKFRIWMTHRFSMWEGSFERHYDYIKPMIICEKYMTTGEDLFDYKFLCMDGKVKYIWVDTGRYKSHHRSLFTTDWRHAGFTIGYPESEEKIVRPERLDEMLDVACKLSSGFPFVRVDLYYNEGQIYFGEMTFTSDSGFTVISPDEWDKKLGDMLDISHLTSLSH